MAEHRPIDEGHGAMRCVSCSESQGWPCDARALHESHDALALLLEGVLEHAPYATKRSSEALRYDLDNGFLDAMDAITMSFVLAARAALAKAEALGAVGAQG